MRDVAISRDILAALARDPHMRQDAFGGQVFSGQVLPVGTDYGGLPALTSRLPQHHLTFLLPSHE